MLTLLVAVVVVQSPLVKRFAAGRETREDAWAMQEGRAFSRRDLATLQKLAQTASRTPNTDEQCERSALNCSSEVATCMSRFAFILSAVETRGQSTPRFLGWAEEVVRDGSDLSALPPARRMLARAKHPGTEALALSLLRDGEYACVAEATRLLSFVPALSDDARQALGSAMRGSNTLDVANLIAARDEPWAQALALKAMRSPDDHLRMGIIQGLRKTASKRLRDAVNFAANCETSMSLRRLASKRLAAIGAKVKRTKCPAPEWKVVGDEVTNGVTRVLLTVASTTDDCDGGLRGARRRSRALRAK